MESKKRPWWQSLEEKDSRPERRQGLSQSLFFSLNSRSCPNWQQILHSNLVTSNKFLLRSHISRNWLLCVCGGKPLYGMQRCSSEVLIITILAKLLQLSCWKFWHRLEIAFRNCLKLSISFDSIQLAFEEDIDIHCPVMATALPLSHKMLFDFSIGPFYPNKTMPMVLWKFAIKRQVCFYQLNKRGRQNSTGSGNLSYTIISQGESWQLNLHLRENKDLVLLVKWSWTLPSGTHIIG